MPPDLKSSTTHSKTGQYTSTETDWGNRTPTPTYTVQDKTNTGQTCTGQQNKLKDAGTRTYKIAKNTLTQTPQKANKSKCTLTKTGTKTNKHTHSNEDWGQYDQQRGPADPAEGTRHTHSSKNWGQYDQQRRPADPAEGTTVQPTKATIGTTDTHTQAKTGASTTNKGDQQIQQKGPQCNHLRRP